jgi:hypothetical protein
METVIGLRMPVASGWPLGSTFGNPRVDGFPATFELRLGALAGKRELTCNILQFEALLQG